MSYPKFYRLVDQLMKQTEAGKVEWKDSFLPNSYQVDFTDYSLILSKDTLPNTPDARAIYKIAIRGETGQTLDEFDNYDLDLSLPDWTYSEKMEELYEGVRRRVEGSEQALDNILAQLTDDDEMPF